jgi:hypothetical protein
VNSLSVEKLVGAIAEAESESLRERARALGQQLQSEARSGEAVKWIEKYSNNFHA